MSKNITITLIILFLIGLVVFIYLLKKNNPNFQSQEFIIKNQKYNLEVAHTLPQKSLGLSNRTNLCQNCGMIFLFNQNGTLPFWMKDTLIPLDMIWINSIGQVTDIITATQTNSTKILQNTQPAKYVIELNAGESNNIGLKIGDIIDLSQLNEIEK